MTYKNHTQYGKIRKGNVYAYIIDKEVVAVLEVNGSTHRNLHCIFQNKKHENGLLWDLHDTYQPYSSERNSFQYNEDLPICIKKLTKKEGNVYRL